MPLPDNTSRNFSPALPSEEANRQIAEMLNPGGSSPGGELTPGQKGDTRVPRPANLTVASAGVFGWGTDFFVLTWTDIDPAEAPVKGYRIYVSNYIDEFTQPMLISSASNSPGIVPLVFRDIQTLVFHLQPVLASGQDLPIADCPTCTASMTGASFIVNGVEASSGHPVQAGFSDSLPDGLGVGRLGIGVLDATDGRRITLAAGLVATENGNQKLGARLVQAGVLAGSGGYVDAADGSGTGKILSGVTARLDGPLGELHLHNGTQEVDYRATSVGTGVPAGVLQGYLEVKVGATTRYIPFYS